MSIILLNECSFNDDGDYQIGFTSSSNDILSVKLYPTPPYTGGEATNVIYFTSNNIKYFSIPSILKSSYIQISIKMTGDDSNWTNPIYIYIQDDPAVAGEINGEYSPPSLWLSIIKANILHQFVFTEGSIGESSTCVSCAFVAMKNVFNFKKNRMKYQHYSIGWIYGNKDTDPNQGEGMSYIPALDKLISDGTPKATLLLGNNNTYYPDNYFYTEEYGNGYTAKKLFDNNQNIDILQNAQNHKITAYTEYDEYPVYEVKQNIVNNGCVLLVTDIYTPSNYNSSTGVFTENIPSGGIFKDGHMMVIIGWKKINNINYWMCINSWKYFDWVNLVVGDNMGEDGIFYFPFFANYGYKQYFVTDCDQTVNEFNWTTPKVSGQGFDLKAEEWNRLIDTITDTYNYYQTVDANWDINSYPMRQVQPTWDFEAENDFNKIKRAIGSKRATGISDKSAGEDIYAGYLNIIVEKLNDLI